MVASMIPVKMEIPVLPRMLMPAHTWTLVGCFGLSVEENKWAFNIIHTGTCNKQWQCIWNGGKYITHTLVCSPDFQQQNLLFVVVG